MGSETGELVSCFSTHSSLVGSIASRDVIANSVNCWNALRAMGTTTQPVKANVMVQKACGLGNQQPSISFGDEGSTTRATARSAQASAKRGGSGIARSRYSLSYSETNRAGRKRSSATQLTCQPALDIAFTVSFITQSTFYGQLWGKAAYMLGISLGVRL